MEKDGTTTTATDQESSSSFEQSIEYQLAEAGVFKDIERLFAQKTPTVKKPQQPKGPVQIMDPKKAKNICKYMHEMMLFSCIDSTS